MVLQARVDAGRRSQQAGELEDARLDAGAHVVRAVDPAPPARERLLGGEAGGDDVGDEYVIPRLLTVTEHAERASGPQQPAEDRDDAGLPMRILPRSVDVSEAQRHACEAIQATVEIQVDLAGQLAGPVGRFREARSLLVERQAATRPLAVDRAARRGEDDRRFVASGGLEHVDGADDVDPGVQAGICHSLSDVHLSGEMKDAVRTEFVDDLVELRRDGDVAFDERSTRLERLVEVLPTPGREVVDDEHLGSTGRQLVGEVGADEAGAAGHESAHLSRHCRFRRL